MFENNFSSNGGVSAARRRHCDSWRRGCCGKTRRHSRFVRVCVLCVCGGERLLNRCFRRQGGGWRSCNDRRQARCVYVCGYVFVRVFVCVYVCMCMRSLDSLLLQTLRQLVMWLLR